MKRFLLGLVALSLIAHVGKLLLDAGVLRRVVPHFSGSCRRIEGPQGPEDLEYNSQLNLIFISANNLPEDVKHPGPNGSIYILDPTVANGEPRAVSPALDFNFYPHGISSFSSGDTTRLFVVNHRADGGSVEVFDWTGTELKYVRSIQSPFLPNNHNDIVATGLDTFYVTVEQGSEDPLMKNLENYTRIGRGGVLYYDGREFTQVSHGLNYANGIAMHPNGGYVLVSEMLALRVRVFERDRQTNALKSIGTIPVTMGPDNLSFEDDGTLWVAGHPKLFDVKAHAADHSRLAPSRIVRVANPLRIGATEEEVFADDGRKISAASVAVKRMNHLYIGSIFTNRMLDCTF
jgi:arylesterase/paraoxonase